MDGPYKEMYLKMKETMADLQVELRWVCESHKNMHREYLRLIEALKDAQRECEEMYMSAGDST